MITCSLIFVGEVLSWVQLFLFMLLPHRSMVTLEEVCMQEWEVVAQDHPYFLLKNLPSIEIYVKVLTFLQFQWRFVVNVKQGMGFSLNFYFPVIGKVWIKQMMVGAFMLPLAVCGTAFFINFIAIYYHASRAIPFGTMVSWFYSVYLKLSLQYL